MTDLHSPFKLSRIIVSKRHSAQLSALSVLLTVVSVYTPSIRAAPFVDAENLPEPTVIERDAELSVEEIAQLRAIAPHRIKKKGKSNQKSPASHGGGGNGDGGFSGMAMGGGLTTGNSSGNQQSDYNSVTVGARKDAAVEVSKGNPNVQNNRISSQDDVSPPLQGGMDYVTGSKDDSGQATAGRDLIDADHIDEISATLPLIPALVSDDEHLEQSSGQAGVTNSFPVSSNAGDEQLRRSGGQSLSQNTAELVTGLTEKKEGNKAQQGTANTGANNNHQQQDHAQGRADNNDEQANQDQSGSKGSSENKGGSDSAIQQQSHDGAGEASNGPGNAGFNGPSAAVTDQLPHENFKENDDVTLSSPLQFDLKGAKVAEVPEPSILWLISSGLLAWFASRSKGRHKP